VQFALIFVDLKIVQKVDVIENFPDKRETTLATSSSCQKLVL